MRLIISDSSCLIDLRKAGLLEAFLRLPFGILIPNTLFEDELLKFSAAQKKTLIDGGLKVVDVPGPGVLRAQEVVHASPRLSIHDGFAFALAEINTGCILVTGDGDLRTIATQHGIEVHGLRSPRLILMAADRARRMAVSDRGTLRGLTQFATQFGFAGSATSL
jgi:hypothetical protein